MPLLYAKEWLCSKRNWHPFRSETSLDLWFYNHFKTLSNPFPTIFQLQLLTRCSFKKAGVENMKKRGELGEERAIRKRDIGARFVYARNQ